MNEVSRKLQLADQEPILVLAAPREFAPHLDEVRQDVRVVSRATGCFRFALGFEGVRMVAIDEDWSALRLRHVDHIRTLKRDPSRALTARGKRRTRLRRKA